MVRLTFTEAQLQARRRALTRFRLLEMLGVLLALGAVASIMYLLPPEQERRHSDLTSAFNAVLAILAMQSAVVTRVGFGLIIEPRSLLKRAAPLRHGWFITAATPVAVLCLLAPWIAAGEFDDRRGSSAWQLAFLLFLLLAAATISGPLLLVAVVLPVELLIRGLVRVATGRSRSERSDGAGQIRLVGFITYLVAMCLMIGGTATIATPQYRGSVWLVVLGLAGNEGVAHPWLLWIGRLMFYAFLVTILWALYSARRQKRDEQEARSKECEESEEREQ